MAEAEAGRASVNLDGAQVFTFLSAAVLNHGLNLTALSPPKTSEGIRGHWGDSPCTYLSCVDS